MNALTIVFEAIGIIRTLFKQPEGVPIQGALRTDLEAQVEIFPQFAEGLKDVDGFSHLILLYHFHLNEGYSLIARPFLDDTPRGVFAIRGSKRPNPVGMTVVNLISRKDNVLIVAGVDMIDGTPLIDIKPYFPEVDSHSNCRTGWVGDKLAKKGGGRIADGRFLNLKK